ncbi:cupin domain-containing protein [Cryobacterium sp. PH29-G1]|uniref:cupin domain-containing protein n=1 Tax=Cryobacterium sp. PH29-G1 TaxID=3046211 RepID=UPI0024B87FC3|nr:cupin domain-containing protein [Cryobacterium sp. PH29-G1]MDJ0349075.1 cupin domain-containing protein [Cryobacterium sp. PH29-G1]
MDTAEEPTTFIADIVAGTIVEAGRPHHTKVLSAPGVRVVVLTFGAGHVLKEHQSPKALLMQTVAGRLRITADGVAHELAPGALLRLDAGLPHMVEALEESRLMLTMIG